MFSGQHKEVSLPQRLVEIYGLSVFSEQ